MTNVNAHEQRILYCTNLHDKHTSLITWFIQYIYKYNKTQQSLKFIMCNLREICEVILAKFINKWETERGSQTI